MNCFNPRISIHVSLHRTNTPHCLFFSIVFQNMRTVLSPELQQQQQQQQQQQLQQQQPQQQSQQQRQEYFSPSSASKDTSTTNHSVLPKMVSSSSFSLLCPDEIDSYVVSGGNMITCDGDDDEARMSESIAFDDISATVVANAAFSYDAASCAAGFALLEDSAYTDGRLTEKPACNLYDDGEEKSDGDEEEEEDEEEEDEEEEEEEDEDSICPEDLGIFLADGDNDVCATESEDEGGDGVGTELKVSRDVECDENGDRSAGRTAGRTAGGSKRPICLEDGQTSPESTAVSTFIDATSDPMADDPDASSNMSGVSGVMMGSSGFSSAAIRPAQSNVIDSAKVISEENSNDDNRLVRGQTEDANKAADTATPMAPLSPARAEVKLTEFYETIAMIFPMAWSHTGEPRILDQANAARGLVECMNIQCQLYDEWLDVMNDYSTVFSQEPRTVSAFREKDTTSSREVQSVSQSDRLLAKSTSSIRASASAAFLTVCEGGEVANADEDDNDGAESDGGGGSGSGSGSDGKVVRDAKFEKEVDPTVVPVAASLSVYSGGIKSLHYRVLKKH